MVSWGFVQTTMKVEDEEEVKTDQRRLPADYEPPTFGPTKHHSPTVEYVFRLVDEIVGLTLVEGAKLGSIIMKKRGMKEPPVVGFMKSGAVGLTGTAMKVTTAASKKRRNLRRL